jgi:glycosyltransferase involved in cell wall biosynthesis
MSKTIGVSMIVRNESAMIEACLDSVKNADEIVIVDTGSEDNTIELCKKYTDKVFEDVWDDDFSRSRNVSLRKCTTDFIIVIDADETLKEPIEDIKRLINEPWFKHDGCQIEIKTAIETFMSPRILRNTPDIYYEGVIHNLPTLKGSVSDLLANMYNTGFHIDSGYSPAHEKDPDRTLRILNRQLSLRPDDTRMMYYISKEYMNRSDIPITVEWLEKYRELKYYNPAKWDNELADALYLLALCYADEVVYGQSRWYDALRTAFESWAVMPTAKGTALLLSGLFGAMPHDDPAMRGKQPLSCRFWEIIAANSTDQNTLMRRN